MHSAQIGNAFSCAAILAAGICFGSLLLTTPSQALDNSSQLLTGGVIGATAGQTNFTAPGVATTLPEQIGGKGESAVQIRMPAGSLRRLQVKLTTQTVPSSGILTVVVRRNGANTTLTCELSKAGECGSNEIVAFAENDKLSIRAINNFVGSGLLAFTYALLFN